MCDRSRWSGWVTVRGRPVHVCGTHEPSDKDVAMIGEIIDLLAQAKLRSHEDDDPDDTDGE